MVREGEMPGSYQFVLYEKKGRIAYVTLNRPEVMNALHPPLVQELEAVWADFIEDADLWIAILTGAGERAFSTGADLKWRANQADQKPLRRAKLNRRHILDRCYKPIIAALNGHALGGGLELALRCDILVAAEHAQLGLPEPRRGIIADAGGVIKLPRRVPYHIAMGLLLTGKSISAQEALRIGLVNQVVPPGELIAAAEQWAAEIMECAPLAVQASKQIVHETIDLPVAEAGNRVDVLEMVNRMRESEDFTEGARAFVEKRQAIWRGK